LSQHFQKTNKRKGADIRRMDPSFRSLMSTTLRADLLLGHVRITRIRRRDVIPSRYQAENVADRKDIIAYSECTILSRQKVQQIYAGGHSIISRPKDHRSWFSPPIRRYLAEQNTCPSSPQHMAMYSPPKRDRYSCALSYVCRVVVFYLASHLFPIPCVFAASRRQHPAIPSDYRPLPFPA
jgi:hypothetical protein